MRGRAACVYQNSFGGLALTLRPRFRLPARAPSPPCSEAKLRGVKVAKEDVDVLAAQYGLSKAVAERVLREAGGDVAAAMRALVFGAAKP
jgi:NACalpha-BTF3-like transcription factor